MSIFKILVMKKSNIKTKLLSISSALFFGAILASTAWAATPAVAPAPNGINLPENYKNWRVISVAHRTDNNTMRAIVGNDKAIEAARKGQTNPWPDGTILGKLAWKGEADPNWATAIVPGKFAHAEFMIKDAKKHEATGGWGYARWLGEDQKPYGKDAGFAQECVACHTPVKGNDYVFTRPAKLP